MTLDDLRKIAEAATEGPWAPWPDQDGTPHMNGLLMVGNADAVIPEGETWIEGVDINPIAHVLTPEDRLFIATFNPKRVLELLDRIERLRHQNSRLMAGNFTPAERADWRGAFIRADDENRHLRARLAAVEKLHKREENDYCDDPECCDLTPTCTDCAVNWPCPTIRAIKETQND